MITLAEISGNVTLLPVVRAGSEGVAKVVIRRVGHAVAWREGPPIP